MRRSTYPAPARGAADEPVASEAAEMRAGVMPTGSGVRMFEPYAALAQALLDGMPVMDGISLGSAAGMRSGGLFTKALPGAAFEGWLGAPEARYRPQSARL